jgi:hypothetical protein
MSRTFLRVISSRGTTPLSPSQKAQIERISSRAPLVIIWVLPVASLTTTDIRFPLEIKRDLIDFGVDFIEILEPGVAFGEFLGFG